MQSNSTLRGIGVGLCLSTVLLAAPGSSLAQEAAGSPAASQEDVANLEARVSELSQRLSVLERRLAAQKALSRKTEELEAQVRALREEVSALRLRQADLERQRREVAAATQGTRNWEIRHHGGLEFTSPGRRFRLRIKSFVVGGWQAGYASTGDATDLESGLVENGFDLVNARLGVDGYLWSDKVSYTLIIETAHRPKLKKFLLKLGPWYGLSVTFGEQKVPDSFQQLRSTSKLQLLTRSPVVDDYGRSYDLGAVLSYAPWGPKFLVELGVFNGSGANVPNADTDLLYVLRMGIAPLGPLSSTEEDLSRRSRPRFWLGGSVLYDRVLMGDLDGDGEPDHRNHIKFGAEGALQWQGFNLQAEFFYTLIDHEQDACPQVYRDTNRPCNKRDGALGAYGQLGYVLPFGLQVAGRLSYAQNYDLGRSGDTWKQIAGPAVAAPELYRLGSYWEATAGLLYDLWAGHLRLGLLYTWRRETLTPNEPGPDEDRDLHFVALMARARL